jgi:hypothetical protein
VREEKKKEKRREKKRKRKNDRVTRGKLRVGEKR